MIQRILDHIHNYFILSVEHGRFKIEQGVLNVDTLQDGQYFKIEGSVFNDGVHKFGSENLQDEEFEGRVSGLGIPKSLLELADEIEDWIDKYGDAANSPYQSESFGGYSYSKRSSGNSGSRNMDNVSWENVFATRLNAYRKIS